MKQLFEIDKKDYREDSPKTVRNSSRAVILKEDKLAMIYSQKNGFLKFPGGGIEANESKIDALIRETKEEAGLVIINDSITEFGYVHRIQKGKSEETFVQDDYYYFCDVEEKQLSPKLTESEQKEEFTFGWFPLPEAISINQSYVEAHPSNTMIERELKVLKLLEEVKYGKNR